MILGQSLLTEEKLMHLDCAVQAHTVLINKNFLQEMNNKSNFSQE